MPRCGSVIEQYNNKFPKRSPSTRLFVLQQNFVTVVVTPQSQPTLQFISCQDVLAITRQ
jgi:hypothetical protein